MQDEESVFEEAIGNLLEATQRLRATHNLLHAQGMLQDPDHHDLVHRISSALAMTEATGVQARRKLATMPREPLEKKRQEEESSQNTGEPKERAKER